jgi:hypothetical protein
MLAVEGGTAPRELTVLLVEDEVLTRLMAGRCWKLPMLTKR